MHTLPLVTIAIPAYKADFLKETILSALNQTYSNIELVIVDDCSPEKIDTIVKEFSDSRIRYYKNEKNIGAKDPSKNWNKCLEYAKGDFFALLCDDDTYEPTFVEEMLNLQREHSDIKVFRARARTIDEKNHVLSWYPSAPTFETCIDYMYHKLLGFRRQTISEFFYDTNYIKKLHGFTNVPRAWTADSLSIYKFAWERGIVSSQSFLVNFRNSQKNISSIHTDAMEKRNALMLFKKEIEGYIKKMPYSSYGKIMNKALYYGMYLEVINLCSAASFGNIFRIIIKGGFPRKWLLFIVANKIASFGNRK